MRLLLTNDDGVSAPGLAALYEAVRDLGEVTIVAPDVERSAAGHAITLSDPLRVREFQGPGGMAAYAVNGTPADCVKIAVRAILPSPAQVVLSGINAGANVGTNVLYSGTVSAATEAAMLGLPAAAFSLADRHFQDFGPAAALSLAGRRPADFKPAASFARKLAKMIHRHGLPAGVSLNVNVPPLPREEIRGVAVTRQGRLRVREWFDERTDPRGNLYYWMAGEENVDGSPKGSGFDDDALGEGFISVTPIHFDLTDTATLKDLETWGLDGEGNFPPPAGTNDV
jgi:5'-nucleotidase